MVMAIERIGTQLAGRESGLGLIIGGSNLTRLDSGQGVTTRRLHTQVACEIGVVVNKTAALKFLEKKLSNSQRLMAQAVFESEVVSVQDYQARPDCKVINDDSAVPPIYRTDHKVFDNSGISIFFVRQDGPWEDSRYFLVEACSIQDVGFVLKELAKYGYSRQLKTDVSLGDA